ncbi:MAG TPA: aldo/keto reductase [Burkholderiales bacterium]|nr:aldo/keto reductase [Burkholderiales bacterium]
MKYRTLGRTGIEISELVFGGGWVGGVLIHQDDATKLRTLRRAMQAGINFVDTAPSYGKGKSEEALGWLLKEISPQPYLSTKVMLDTENLDDIRSQVERSVNESLERLQRDSVDLLQLHNPIEQAPKGNSIGVDFVIGEGGAADALEHIRAQGLTRFIGFTALGDAASCRRVIDSGRFDTAQVYYNLLNPSAARAMPARWTGHDFGNLIAACTARRMGIMAIRVFAAGVLASDTRHGREVVITREADLSTEERRARAAFAVLGARYGTRAQTALRFALANPDISCAVIGLAEPAHLEEALAGAALGPLPQQALRQLEEVYSSNFGL